MTLLATLPSHVASVWSDGAVSVTTREVAARYLALYGEPVPAWRPATVAEIADYERAERDAAEIASRIRSVGGLCRG